MGTTDVSVLTRRIQELEKENARLKAILDKNGIEYDSFESKTCETNHFMTYRKSSKSSPLYIIACLKFSNEGVLS